MLTFAEKYVLTLAAPAVMESSKRLCLADADRLRRAGRDEIAEARLEKAAQYAWGFNRPAGWRA